MTLRLTPRMTSFGTQGAFHSGSQQRLSFWYSKRFEMERQRRCGPLRKKREVTIPGWKGMFSMSETEWSVSFFQSARTTVLLSLMEVVMRKANDQTQAGNKMIWSGAHRLHPKHTALSFLDRYLFLIGGSSFWLPNDDDITVSMQDCWYLS